MLPRAFFLHVVRDGLHNAQSLLEAREKYHGDRKKWYSAKPREYETLRQLDPMAQVAGQIHYTSRAIEEGLDQLPEQRWMRIGYEEFCNDPALAWRDLRAKLFALGFELPADYAGPSRFEHTNVDRLTPADISALREAWQSVTAPRV